MEHHLLSMCESVKWVYGRWKQTIDGFYGTFAMGAGGHYITMMPADWSISTPHIFLPSSFYGEKCYGIHL